ncbi:hypothetical protein PIB30_089255 [Stylosanthes scabra]|uniref:Uncharacterized protein n=1 Tax=Stylosanthes scabra TaxID=79078 RepID=A0ABU6VSL7_9FABA|nr:hypothetical protein [Stylosanthes scabra]
MSNVKGVAGVIENRECRKYCTRHWRNAKSGGTRGYCIGWAAWMMRALPAALAQSDNSFYGRDIGSNW